MKTGSKISGANLRRLFWQNYCDVQAKIKFVIGHAKVEMGESSLSIKKIEADLAKVKDYQPIPTILRILLCNFNKNQSQPQEVLKYLYEYHQVQEKRFYNDASLILIP